jgi:hypothetical protein
MCLTQRQDEVVLGSLAVDDPMLLEAALSPTPVLEVVTFDSLAPPPTVCAPELEVEQASILNVEHVPSQPSVVVTDPTLIPTSQPTTFVNTLCGSSPDGLQEGVLPMSPSSFLRVLAKSIASTVLYALPPL